jgi:hypothetical protein
MRALHHQSRRRHRRCDGGKGNGLKLAAFTNVRRQQMTVRHPGR